MFVSNLGLYNFRKFQNLSLNFTPYINFLLGPNASGKTSLLEALYLISHGNSCRTTNLKNISYNGNLNFQLKVGLNDCLFKELKYNYHNGRSKITSNTKPIVKRSELTNELCIRLVNDNSFRIIDSGPKYLRSFIDWQILNHYSDYLEYYRIFRHCKEQLKYLSQLPNNKRQIEVWLEKYISCIQNITLKRNEYLQILTNEIKKNTDTLYIFKNVNISFDVGYSQLFIDDPYKEYLKHKTTHMRFFPGPHRARIQFIKFGENVNNYFSRGQLKVFMISLQVIVNQILDKYSNKKGVILIDDLPSELDDDCQKYVAELFNIYKFQYFLTSTNSSLPTNLPLHKETFQVHQLS